MRLFLRVTLLQCQVMAAFLADLPFAWMNSRIANIRERGSVEYRYWRAVFQDKAKRDVL